MKKEVRFYSVFALLVAVVIMSFTVMNTEVKPAVKFTVPEWQTKIDIIGAAKQVLQQSNAPANVVLPLSDSLTKFQQELIQQIRPQIPATPDSSKSK